MLFGHRPTPVAAAGCIVMMSLGTDRLYADHVAAPSDEQDRPQRAPRRDVVLAIHGVYLAGFCFILFGYTRMFLR